MRRDTRFLGNLVYNYADICTVVQSPVVGTGKLYPQDMSYP